MAKSKAAGGGSFFQELIQVGLYKRSQGRVARQLTFAAAAVVSGVGAVPPRHRVGDPGRGDVVVFRLPSQPKTNYIKRIAGLPGEWIRICHGDQIGVGNAVELC